MLNFLLVRAISRLLICQLSKSSAGHKHHSIYILFRLMLSCGQVCIKRGPMVVPNNLSQTIHSSTKPPQHIIRNRNYRLLQRDSLIRRVIYQDCFHAQAIEIFAPISDQFKTDKCRHFSNNFASMYTVPMNYIICTGNIYTGTRQARKFQLSMVLLNDRSPISLADTLLASTATSLTNMSDPGLKTLVREYLHKQHKRILKTREILHTTYKPAMLWKQQTRLCRHQGTSAGIRHQLFRLAELVH